MGDVEGQGGLEAPVFFLDENHSGNPHLYAAFRDAGILFERHQDHFLRGTDDTVWIPVVAGRRWAVLTADARIRHNQLERQAVRANRLRLFYFSRNDFSGTEMGSILRKALPRMLKICREEGAPFAVSISRSGDVKIQDAFPEVS